MAEFEKRERGACIISVFESGHARLYTCISPHLFESVTLVKDGCDVIVEDIQKTFDGRFRGKVCGFEPPDQEIVGINTGDIVRFGEKNVMTVSFP